MKVLKYIPENLEKIATTVDQTLEQVTADYEESVKLELVIWSVVDFQAFNTGDIIPEAYFITEALLSKFYMFDLPILTGEYTVVTPK